MNFIKNPYGHIAMHGEWAKEQHFTIEALANGSETIHILKGRIIISVVNGSARYVITGVDAATDTIIGRLELSSLLFPVNEQGERISVS